MGTELTDQDLVDAEREAHELLAAAAELEHLVAENLRLKVELERVAAERDTARELARDAVAERDRIQAEVESLRAGISYAVKRREEETARADAIRAKGVEIVTRVHRRLWEANRKRIDAEARAAAAWRSGAEAMKACAAAVLRAGADCHAPAAKMRSALHQAAKVVEILDPPKQPPPSATPGEEVARG